MVPRSSCLAALLVLLFAPSAAPAPAFADVGPGSVEAFELRDCTVDQGFYPIARSDASARVPAGFDPIVFGEFFLTPLPSGAATGELDLGFLTCGEAVLGGAVLPADRQVFSGVVVRRPAAPYGEDGIDMYLVHQGGIYAHEAIASTYRAWGQAAAPAGGVARSSEDPAPALRRTDGTAVLGDASLRMLNAYAMSPVDRPAERLRFFYVHDGVVVGAMDAYVGPHVAVAGASTFEVRGGHGWLAELPQPVDAGISATIISPRWDILVRRVTFPH